MRLNHLALLVFVTCSLNLNGQSKNQHWDISVGYGLSLPVGAFKKVTPEKSLAYFNDHQDINGFDKDGNSAAQNGSSALVKVDYWFQRSWGIMLHVGYTKNAVNTQPATDYVNDWIVNVLPNQTLAFIQEDYKVLTTSIGIGYNFSKNRFIFSLYPSIGLAMLSSPEYVMTRQAQNYPTPALYTYSIDESKIYAPLFGLNGAILYDVSSHFFVGLDAAYNHANFEYVWTMKSPGIDPYSRTDKVTYRTVQLIGKVGFRF
jgi:hypothetical protein